MNSIAQVEDNGIGDIPIENPPLTYREASIAGGLCAVGGFLAGLVVTAGAWAPIVARWIEELS